MQGIITRKPYFYPFLPLGSLAHSDDGELGTVARKGVNGSGGKIEGDGWKCHKKKGFGRIIRVG